MAATAAAIGVLGGVRLPVAAGGVVPLPLRSTSLLSPRCYSSSSFSLPLGFAPLILSDARKASFHVRASSEERSSPIETDELFSDLKAKWDAVENKSAVFLYGGGALVGVWLSTIIVGAINSVPLLPKLMELVGLGYTGWFVYRYLLFKSCRKELIEDIETLKKKIAGTGD